MEYTIIRISDAPQHKQQAAQWFHSKWGVPLGAYLESMEQSLTAAAAVPQWYVAMLGGQIIGGLGVIENDFHDRTDLTPNVCAVFVEPDWRNRGVAGALLRFVCEDMAAHGIDTLYLLTDHTGFYERYGWAFFCMAQADGEDAMSRMYVHRQR